MTERISQTTLLRVAAFVVDALVLALLLVIPCTVISYAVVWLGLATKWTNLVWYSAVVVLAVGILLRDGLRGGRSLGKQILGLRIDTSDGRPCSVVRSIVRNLPLVLPVWNLLEVWLVLRGGKRTGDRIAGTVVTEE